MLRRSVWVAVLLVGCLTAEARAQFVAPDLATVQVVGADRGVLTFPVTAHLDVFRVEPGAMTIATNGTASWPALAIESGGEPVQSATLWVFLRIQGQWYATGAERLRPAQLNGTKPEADGPGELATLIGNGWLYDAGRWRPMAGYNPAFGEPVCVMVAAGSTRSDNNTPVRARTQVRCLSWPNGPTMWEEGQAAPPDTPPVPNQPPTPNQPPPPSPQPSGVDLSGLEARVATLETKVDAVSGKVDSLATSDKNEHDAIIKAVNSPSWLGQVGKFLTSPTGMSMASAAGGFLTYWLTHQAPATTATSPATTPTAQAAAIGLRVSFALR